MGRFSGPFVNKNQEYFWTNWIISKRIPFNRNIRWECQSTSPIDRLQLASSRPKCAFSSLKNSPTKGFGSIQKQPHSSNQKLTQVQRADYHTKSFYPRAKVSPVYSTIISDTQERTGHIPTMFPQSSPSYEWSGIDISDSTGWEQSHGPNLASGSFARGWLIGTLRCD